MTQHDVRCDAVREALLDEERSDEIVAHLEGCAECRALAEALAAVDARLAEMPALEVPDALLARTMERVDAERAEHEGGVAAIFGGLLTALAGGLWALVKLAIAPFRTTKGRRFGLAGIGIAVPAVAALGLVLATERDAILQGPAAPMEEAEEQRASLEANRGGELDLAPASPGSVDRDAEEEPLGAARDATGLQAAQPAARPIGATDSWWDEGLAERSVTTSSRDLAEATIALPPAELAQNQRREHAADLGGLDVGAERPAPADTPAQAAAPVAGPAPTGATTIVAIDEEVPHREAPSLDRAIELSSELRDARDDTGAAARFLASREQVDGLSFVPATGYWASTYVPGDPALRLLRRRLTDTPAALALAEHAEPGDLALDPPARGAIALHVSADRAAVEGRSRVLVSVGLRGATARAGRRPTLRAEVVIDARRPLDDEAQGRVRALLMALSRGRQGADRVGVIVAGPKGGELLPLGELRFGELTVALRRLFDVATTEARPMSLEDAARRAMVSVGSLDGASSPLASALVLVVSPGLSDADARALEPLVHAGTLAGVTTTALGLSDAAALDPLDRIALAGQGRRRVLSSLEGAEALVRGEVEAVSQVVARAVRLHVRLAPGVQLVGVVGSRRLDGDETRRVREAEEAVDRRLARQLGIASDRGADDDGIQIVIPAFYADDAHAVLLDLVVPGPGPVADVSVQMKDLVRLENATASARVTLSRGAGERGPRGRQVLGQLVGHEVAAALRDAARSLDAGDVDGARARIEEARQLVVGMRGLASVPASDVPLLRAYDGAIREGADHAALAASLRYASHRRLEGDPLAIDGR